jgi:hypothetical protein
MGDHLWALSDVLAAAMLLVAVYCTGRLVFSLGSRRAAPRDSDVVHIVMGISMAGMLAPSLAVASSGLWVVVFSASAVWFGWRVAHEAEREELGSHVLGQHLPHLLMSAAMVYMLFVAQWSGSMGDAHGTALLTMGAARWPSLTVTIAVLLLGDGVLAFGLSLRQLVPQIPGGGWALARVGDRHHDRRGPGGGPSVRAGETSKEMTTTAARALAPRSEMVCQLVMSLAMGYMLLSLA